MNDFFIPNSSCETYVIAPTGSDIVHHGRLGQRWGKKNGPPYPLNASGLKAFLRQKKAQKTAKVEAKKKEAERKAAEAEAKKAEKMAKEKEKFLRTATPAETLNNKAYLNNSDLQYISDRLTLESKISSHQPKRKTYWDTFSSVNKRFGDVVSFSNNAIKMYNNLANFYNSIPGQSEKLPEVNINNKKKGNKKKKQNGGGNSASPGIRDRANYTVK